MFLKYAKRMVFQKYNNCTSLIAKVFSECCFLSRVFHTSLRLIFPFKERASPLLPPYTAVPASFKSTWAGADSVAPWHATKSSLRNATKAISDTIPVPI